jgi:poly-gamma-glutamate synthesis protein (capsule biosynthesis protein)
MKYLLIFGLLIGSGKIRSQDTTRVSLIFFGDVMQHDSQIADAYNPTLKTYDYNPCFQFVKAYFESADFAIGNLELTLAGPPFKGYPQFSAPDQLARTLKGAGVDILVTANNHSVDRRKGGIDRTIQMLDSMNILHTGTFRDTVDRMNDYPLMISKNDIKIALLNYTYGTNGIPVPKDRVVNLIDTALMRKDLARAAELVADATIVFVHWGNEYQRSQSALQERLTEFCFNRGATLVIGSHPHVIQPMEWRKNENRMVVYSLGNFVSGQRDRYKNGGAMVRVELEKVNSDSSSMTKIDTAGYILQWVYRTVDTNKDYYVLPVQDFENDTTGFIKDSYSKSALKLFASDSRKLLNEKNVGVSEWKQAFRAKDSVTYLDSAGVDCPRPAECDLKPDPGKCKAATKRYYYDAVEKKCKEFLWGGCGGVAPFETMDACKACECIKVD